MDLKTTYGSIEKAVREDDGETTYEFCMSDASVDRVGDIIEISGWDLRQFKSSNPVALYGHDQRSLPIGRWEKVRIEAGKLLGRLRLQVHAAGTFEWQRIEAIKALLTDKGLNAVSVGFQPLKYEPIDKEKPWDGYRFLKQVLLECSVVAVPANGNAVMQRSLARFSPNVVRSLLAESGIQQPIPGGIVITGKSAVPPNPTAERGTNPGSTKMNLSERIQAAQAEMTSFLALQDPMFKTISEGGDLSADDQAEFDRIEGLKGPLQKRIDTMVATEKSLGQSAGRIQHPQQLATPGIVTEPIVLRNIPSKPKNEKPREIFVKLAAIHLKAYVDRKPVDVVRQEMYPDRADVDACVKTMLAMVSKATTNPAMTTVATWAAELVETGTLDLMESLVADTVYPNLAARGQRFNFDRFGKIKIPRRDRVRNAPGDLRGAFVGEGQPIPVRRGSFGSIELTPHKMGVISTWTREQAQQSTPQIEGIIRDGINEDTGEAIDQALLDAIGADAIRPAGLLNGVTAVAGSTAAIKQDQIVADIEAAVNPFITANAAGGLVWLINPANILKLQFITSPLGGFPFRDQVNAGVLGGIPFIASTHVPLADLILVRGTDFMSATADTPEFDVSETATIHEDDGGYPADQAMRAAATVLPIATGTSGAAAVTAAPVRSLWQTASIGLRMILPMDWAVRRTGMVSVVTIGW